MAISVFSLSTAWADAKPSPEQLADQARAQRAFATKLYLAQLRRAQRVTYALMKSATPYCINLRKYSIGIPPLGAEDLPDDLRQGWRELASPPQDGMLRFEYVVPGSPAGRAGLRDGDVLVSMVDEATRKAVMPSWGLDRPANTFVGNLPIMLNFRRGDIQRQIKVLPQLVCDVRPRLVRSNTPTLRVATNALTVSTGMLNLLPNDNELALLIAHEFIRHEDDPEARNGVQPGANPRTNANRQNRADYLGIYLVSAAGFNVDEALPVWSRLSAAFANEAAKNTAPFPQLSPSRGIFLAETQKEIRQKMLAGLPIVPGQQGTVAFLPSDGMPDTTPLGAPGDNDPARTEDAALRAIKSIPFIDSEGMSGYQRFLDSPLRPRAFAIGPSKRGPGAWSYRFGTNASANALAHCSLLARGPCYLYAVDNQLVWNPETASVQPAQSQSGAREPLLGAPAASGYAAIDDLQAVPIKQSDLPRYQAFLEKPAPRAFIVTESGESRYWIGPSAMHDALAYCALRAEPCWLYAVNDSVVWQKNVEKRISSANQLSVSNPESGFLDK